jgi:hypothetical protein
MSTLGDVFQPLKKSRIPRDVVDINGELVVINGVVEVNRCDGCIQ